MRGRMTIAVALAAALTWTGAAEAKTFEVTRTNDPNPGKCKKNDCSLREAVEAANTRAGKDKIVLPNRKRAYRLTRGGAGDDANLTGDLDINNDPLAIVHPGKGKATIDARSKDRALHIQAGAATRLAKLKFVKGSSGLEDGGAIATEARLSVARSVFVGNLSGDDGGAIDADDAALRIVGSRFIGNNAASSGAINGDSTKKMLVVRTVVKRNNAVVSEGGGIETGQITLKNSTVTGNAATQSGGGINPSAGSRIVGSTIAGNRAGDHGGGVYFEDDGALRITNSTITKNRAELGGGGIQADDPLAELKLNAVTVARNVANIGGVGLQGGGLHNLDSATFEVRNSLIALNLSGDERNDCEGNLFQSLGDNLLSTRNAGECEGFNQQGDFARSNPKIAKLRPNGGPTKTIGLRKGSPAIGKAHRPSAPNRDQRGRKRDKKPDIGAFERGA